MNTKSKSFFTSFLLLSLLLVASFSLLVSPVQAGNNSKRPNITFFAAKKHKGHYDVGVKSKRTKKVRIYWNGRQSTMAKVGKNGFFIHLKNANRNTKVTVVAFGKHGKDGKSAKLKNL